MCMYVYIYVCVCVCVCVCVESFGRKQTLPVISRLFLAGRTNMRLKRILCFGIQDGNGKKPGKNLGNKYRGHSGYHTM